MRFSVWPRQQQAWGTVLSLAEQAEATGWDGIWFADHFMPNFDDDAGRPLTDPVIECLTTLAGLAVAVPRLRLGSLVCSTTYRHPAVLAKKAATIDHLSGGRFVLGVGAGWQLNEHRAFGIALGTVRQRLDRLEEACEVLHSLFREERTTFDGDWFQVLDAPCEPRPSPPLPLLVGGAGERRTLRIVARWADEWNLWGTPDTVRHKRSVLERHCEEVGRDPAEIAHSAQALVFLSEDQSVLDELRSRDIGRAAIIGTAAELQEVVAAYAEAGVDELVVPDFNLSMDERADVFDHFMTDVAAPLRSSV